MRFQALWRGLRSDEHKPFTGARQKNSGPDHHGIKTKLSLETLFEKHFLTIFTGGYATDGSCKDIMRKLERRQGAAATSLRMAIGLPNDRRTKQQQLNYLTIVPVPDESKPVSSLFMTSHKLFGTTVLDKWYVAIPKIDVGGKHCVLQSALENARHTTSGNQNKDTDASDDEKNIHT